MTKPKHTPLTLEQSGLIIELYNSKTNIENLIKAVAKATDGAE